MGFVINDRTGEAIKKIRNLSSEGLIDFAEKIVDGAKVGTPILTGNNKDLIGTDAHDKMRASVFTRSGYGAWLELGTSRMPARPYFAPAIATAINEFTDGKKWGQ